MNTDIIYTQNEEADKFIAKWLLVSFISEVWTSFSSITLPLHFKKVTCVSNNSIHARMVYLFIEDIE